MTNRTISSHRTVIITRAAIAYTNLVISGKPANPRWYMNNTTIHGGFFRKKKNKKNDVN